MLPTNEISLMKFESFQIDAMNLVLSVCRHLGTDGMMGDSSPIDCRLVSGNSRYNLGIAEQFRISTNVLRNRNRVAQVAILATFLR